MTVDLVPLVIGLIGAGGLGAFFREIVTGVSKIAGGMSARESKRSVDIVQQRDAAITREEHAWRQVDREAAKRRDMQDYAARLRVRVIELGGVPEPEPVLSRTVTRAELSNLEKREPAVAKTRKKET